ncbi:MAG: hypothetical protein H0X18_12850, partial [Geodermatophilaceae bacterium]|nr:hypothetical protein [Geodermatophilaceae bacterium]
MSKFPQRLSRGNGEYLTLDETRLLLATREASEREELAGRLEEVGLILEDARDDRDARTMERVNHTPTRFWVRSADGERLSDDRFSAIPEALGGIVAWVGPVYRLVGRGRLQGRENLLCPLPDVLL